LITHGELGGMPHLSEPGLGLASPIPKTCGPGRIGFLVVEEKSAEASYLTSP
jgi:hypothetical protein